MNEKFKEYFQSPTDKFMRGISESKIVGGKKNLVNSVLNGLPSNLPVEQEREINNFAYAFASGGIDLNSLPPDQRREIETFSYVFGI